MSSLKLSGLIVCLLALGAPVTAIAQERAPADQTEARQDDGRGGAELGYDFCFLKRASEQGSPDSFVSLPGGDSLVPSVRAGFYLSQRGQLQLDVGMNHYTGIGAESFGVLFGLGYLAELAPRHRANVPYLRLGGLLRYSDDYAGYPGTRYEYTQFGVAAGVGVKSFVTKRVAVRFEAGLVRWLATTDILDNWTVSGKVGISVFTG